MNDDTELPGMWEGADLSGGKSDTPEVTRHKYSGGSQNWPKAEHCNGFTKAGSCNATGDHLHCTDIEGSPARFERGDRTRGGLNLFTPPPPPLKGYGRVTGHWHYEGCMVQVTMLDGTEVELVPSLYPDHVEVLSEEPSELQYEKWAVEGVL